MDEHISFVIFTTHTLVDVSLPDVTVIAGLDSTLLGIAP